MIRIIIFFFAACNLLFMPNALSAQSIDAKKPVTTAPGSPQKEAESTAKRADWINQMQQNLPVNLCESSNFIRQCYTVTEFDCLVVTRHAVQGCLKRMEQDLPDLFTVKDGEHWGGITAHCAFTKFAEFMTHTEQKDCPKTAKITTPSGSKP